mgnify:FL=1
MADEINKIIKQMHDLQLEKEHVISDQRYHNYLPAKHQFLRNLFKLWIFLVILAVLLFIFHLVYLDLDWLNQLIFHGMLIILIYTMFMGLLSLILYATDYTVPVAVTNEIKAKRVVKFNKKLSSLKDILNSKFTGAFINYYMTQGGVGGKLAMLSSHVESYIKSHYPNIKFIRELLTTEFMQRIEVGAKNFIDEKATQIAPELIENPVNLEKMAMRFGWDKKFLVQLIKHMTERGMVSGNFTELQIEFIPEAYAIGPPGSIASTEQSTQEITNQEDLIEGQAISSQEPQVEQTQSQTATSTSLSQNAAETAQVSSSPAGSSASQDASTIQSPQTTSPAEVAGPTPMLVESEGVQNVPSIDKAKADIDVKRQQLEALRAEFEKGTMGIDEYVNKSEIMENELDFLKHRLTLLERVQNPTKTCMSCFQPVNVNAPDLVRCPNNHVFHMECAHNFLLKHEICPWCREHVESVPEQEF